MLILGKMIVFKIVDGRNRVITKQQAQGQNESCKSVAMVECFGMIMKAKKESTSTHENFTGKTPISFSHILQLQYRTTLYILGG